MKATKEVRCIDASGVCGRHLRLNKKYEVAKYQGAFYKVHSVRFGYYGWFLKSRFTAPKENNNV